MGPHSMHSMVRSMGSGRLDWSSIRGRIDLAAIATALLGPAAKTQGFRLFWHCPFHEDRHPSFEVNPARKTWKCWPCNLGGDAPALLMRLKGMAFPEAVRLVAELSGVVAASAPPLSRGRMEHRERIRRPTAPETTGPATVPLKAPDTPPERPSGLPLAEALALVTEAARRLWGPEGAEALAYLRGRGLTDETIRAARLGVVASIAIPTRDGDRTFRARGVVIPWFDGDRLAMVKIRQPEGRGPKYVEAFRDRPMLYPDPAVIAPGDPLIICEGELDTLLMAQQLPEASVITLGGASAEITTEALIPMLFSPRWFAAMDADQAGDAAAAKFPRRAIRVRPPEGDKDWTDVHRGGWNRIRCHWGPYLGLALSWEQLEPKGELRP